nr:hypothetical protein [Sinimarinibacterium flocculans]
MLALSVRGMVLPHPPPGDGLQDLAPAGGRRAAPGRDLADAAQAAGADPVSIELAHLHAG